MSYSINRSNEVFHLWASQAKSQVLRKGGRNYWFSGKTFYSYNAPIARIMNNGVVLFNNTRYSNTTSGHLASCRQAANHMPSVGGFSAGNSHHDSEEHVHRLNLVEFDRQFAQAVKQLLVYPKRKVTLGRAILFITEARAAYQQAFDLNWPALDQSAVEAQMAEAAQNERRYQAERAERDKAAAEARTRTQAENLERWRAGENPGCRFEQTALRLSRDLKEIETSHGAVVPVEVASMLWKGAQKCRESNTSWSPSTGMQVGHYLLARVEADGLLVIGCHTIPFEELVPIAAQLGLPAHAPSHETDGA